MTVSAREDTLRQQIAQLTDSEHFRNFIIGVIIFNAIILGLETSGGIMSEIGGLLTVLDDLCLAIFVVEIGLKIYAHRLAFFRSAWNLFDILIVGIALAPTGEGLSVLRALRILRVLRVVSVAPAMRRVVAGFLNALPGMGSVIVLMCMIFYVAAVMATKLFGEDFPDWFGTIGESAYTLFQIMTLESWSMGIVRPVMEVYPSAWIFFVPFIMATTFAVVNLLVGLVVNSIQEVSDEALEPWPGEHPEDETPAPDAAEGVAPVEPSGAVLRSVTAAEALVARDAGATLVDLRRIPVRETSGEAIDGAELRDPLAFGHDDALTKAPGMLLVYGANDDEAGRFATSLLRMHGRDARYVQGGFEALKEAGAPLAGLTAKTEADAGV